VLDAYVGAGGGIVGDLFESDFGGWLTDPALLDRLVDARLTAEREWIAAEGWKWVATAIDLPWEATRGTRPLEREEVAMSEERQQRLAELYAEGEALQLPISRAAAILP
jgi:ParB family chromosome partitioning protein